MNLKLALIIGRRHQRRKNVPINSISQRPNHGPIFNTLMPSCAYMSHWVNWVIIGSGNDLPPAWCKVITAEQMLPYCQLNPQEQASVKLQPKYRWVSTRKTWLQCISNGVVSFLHEPVNIIIFSEDNLFENVVCKMSAILLRPQWTSCLQGVNPPTHLMAWRAKINFQLGMDSCPW